METKTEQEEQPKSQRGKSRKGKGRWKGKWLVLLLLLLVLLLAGGIGFMAWKDLHPSPKASMSWMPTHWRAFCRAIPRRRYRQS